MKVKTILGISWTNVQEVNAMATMLVILEVKQ